MNIFLKMNIFIAKYSDEIQDYSGFSGLILFAVIFRLNITKYWMLYLATVFFIGFFLVKLEKMLKKYTDSNNVSYCFYANTISIIVSAMSNFFLLGVYGIIIAVLFVKLGV